MIDTDKYEGHTPAPWDADDDGAGGNLHIDAEDVRLPINWADTQLMADAPLLLAEVKRLREQLAKANKYVHTICQHSDSMLMDYEDYMKGSEEE